MVNIGRLCEMFQRNGFDSVIEQFKLDQSAPVLLPWLIIARRLAFLIASAKHSALIVILHSSSLCAAMGTL